MWTKEDQNKSSQKYYWNNKEKVQNYKKQLRLNKKNLGLPLHDPLSEKFSRIKRLYGITREQFLQMWNDQSGKCDICKIDMDLNKNSKNAVHVDHDHLTGNVRGLLCQQCNITLSIIERGLAEPAVSYIKKHGGLA